LKVFVTDGEYKHSLAIARALATHSVEVHVGSTDARAQSFYSKYTTKKFLYPDPTSKWFLRAVESIDETENYDVILPVGNETWFSFETGASKSLKRKIPMAPTNSYLIACNKAKTIALAEDLGIPIPKTFLSGNPLSKLSRLRYPAILKPAFGSGGASIVHNPKDALALCRTTLKEREFVIQELVRGDGYGFFALYNKGNRRAHFMHRRIRETPPTGGPSSAAESVLVPELLALGSKLLDQLSWHGVAMVEFKRDGESGEFKLLEINPKFWGSLDLAISAGVNFPYLAACMVAYGDIEPPSSYDALRYCWPFPDDFRHLRARPESFLSVLRDWCDFSVKKNVWLNDVGPHLSLAAVLGAARARRIISKAHGVFEPRRFSWVMPWKLAASGRPTSKVQLTWLKRQGISAILDLTEGAPFPTEWVTGLEYKRIPMQDHMPPHWRELAEAVGFISEQIAQGRCVLVHCLGGLGRTGTVLACYLVKDQGLMPEDAIREVRKSRPGSIESSQEASVLSYSEAIE